MAGTQGHKNTKGNEGTESLATSVGQKYNKKYDRECEEEYGKGK